MGIIGPDGNVLDEMGKRPSGKINIRLRFINPQKAATPSVKLLAMSGHTAFDLTLTNTRKTLTRASQRMSILIAMWSFVGIQKATISSPYWPPSDNC
jgi:hypothetical protein